MIQKLPSLPYTQLTVGAWSYADALKTSCRIKLETWSCSLDPTLSCNEGYLVRGETSTRAESDHRSKSCSAFAPASACDTRSITVRKPAKITEVNTKIYGRLGGF